MNVFKYFVSSLLMLIPTVNTKAQGWKNPVGMSGQQSYDVGDPQVIKYRGVYYLYCSSATKACCAGHRATSLIGLMPLW